MQTRPNLDDFMSIVCFKSAISGMEDLLGEEGTAAALIAAGRKRGKIVADSTGLTGTNASAAQLAEALNNALGKAGTRLCKVEAVEDTDDGGYLVKTTETVCMSGEAPDSTRTCTYTLGAVMGAVEAATGKSLIGKHVANSLHGSPTDDFKLTPLG